MPRGAKPKVYPAQIVAAVATAYAKGQTQTEIAADLWLREPGGRRVTSKSGSQAEAKRKFLKRKRSGKIPAKFPTVITVASAGSPTGTTAEVTALEGVVATRRRRCATAAPMCPRKVPL